jgi:PAS domain S-box-containing protein
MFDEFFHDIFDHSFGGIILIREDMRIKNMNKAAEKITGFPESEAIGKYCSDILRAKCCKDACPVKEIKAGGTRNEFVVDIIAKDNRRKYIKTKIINTHGYWVQIFNDITREVELEKRVKEKYVFEDIITQDKGLINILGQFPKIAGSLVPVLFEGESGVGKEVFANAIQAISSRKEKPYVKINCAALPDTLLESELFGYKKGAFTDARQDKPGLFVVANEGTLFLDEIGEMSLQLQAKLLRAVETGEVIPLGSTSPEKTDVRILAATNKNLFDEIEKGTFRDDLFYRLNVVSIKIPSLKNRINDVPLFIDYFINHLNIIHGKNIQGVSDEVLNALMDHPFPGNIRELRNIIEYAFVFCNEGSIEVQHIPEYIRPIGSGKRRDRPFSSGEREQIIEALKKACWNKKEAAEILKIDRTTLWRKMKKYNIK